MQKTYFELSQGICLLARVSALVAVVLLLTGTALAQDTIVDCDEEPLIVADFNDLQDAINSLKPGGGTMVVSGTCERPDFMGSPQPFLVNDFTGRLTIEGDPFVAPNVPPASTLMQAVIACGTDLTISDPVPSAVLDIRDSSDVRLKNLFITGGEGVSISNSDVNFGGFVWVTQSRFSGVEISGSTGRTLLFGNDHNRIAENCRHGIFVGSGRSLSVLGTTLIEDNGAFGVTGRDGASLTFSQNCFVGNNGWGGANARFGSSILITGNCDFTGNGTADPSTPNFFFPRFRAGVSVTAGSNLVIFRNDDGIPEILDNVGPGILLDLASIGQLLGMTVTGNSQGFVAQHNSTAEFIPETALNTIRDNNGVRVTKVGNTGLLCDSTSVLIGDFSEVDKFQCASVGGREGVIGILP